MDNIKTLKYRGIYSVEYGYISPHILNPKNRIPNADGTITYKYIFLGDVFPTGGRIVNYDKFRILEVDVTPEVYNDLVELDRIEYNNNHKHDRRRKELITPADTDEPFDDTNETVIHKAINDKWKSDSYTVEDDTIAKLDDHYAKQKILTCNTLTRTDRRIYRLSLLNYNQTRIAQKLGVSQGTVSNHLKKIEQLLDYYKNDEDNLNFDEYRVKKLKQDYRFHHQTDDMKALHNFRNKLTSVEWGIACRYAKRDLIGYLAELLFLHSDKRKQDLKQYLAVATDEQKLRLKQFKGESERAAYARLILQDLAARKNKTKNRRKKKRKIKKF